MSQIAMPTPRGTRFTPRVIVAKASFSDDEDAITPCSSPPPEPQDALSHQEPQQSPLRLTASKSEPNSTAPSPKTSMTHWQFDPTEGEEMDDWQLWQRMLEIQRTFHCYNSARMSAALLELEMGVDAEHLVPSRSCLDLMNESVSAMVGDERQKLAEWLHENPSTQRRSRIWKQSATT